MGTYHWLKDDKIIQDITRNDLMRWRGGQLSLNAVCTGIKMIDCRDSDSSIKILPCKTFNRPVTKIKEVQQLKKENYAYIAHIKGKAKFT